MKFVQYQDCKSPHQLPLARELLRRLGVDNFRFVYRDADQSDRAAMGWKMAGSDEPWQLHIGSHPEEVRELLENAEVLLTGMREIDLFERRAAKGLKTFYQMERWFKPIGFAGCLLPGVVKLLHPCYFSMSRRLRGLAKRSLAFHVLPIGVHALRDMQLIGVPDASMTTWGYFVEPSRNDVFQSCKVPREPKVCRILWVGRLLRLKRVDVIVRAVSALKRENGSLPKVTLDVYGIGPEEDWLRKLAKGHEGVVAFHPSVSIDEVRKLMREYDVYVFASDGHDGWGAVVSEALEEGMVVLGTRETGASATMLPQERLFSAGDVQGLIALLRKAAAGEFKATGIGKWSVANAVNRLFRL